MFWYQWRTIRCLSSRLFPSLRVPPPIPRVCFASFSKRVMCIPCYIISCLVRYECVYISHAHPLLLLSTLPPSTRSPKSIERTIQYQPELPSLPPSRHNIHTSAEPHTAQTSRNIMGLSNALLTGVTALVGLLIALFVFRQIAVPAAIYIYNLLRYGDRQKAENEALDSMGENKMSYGVKGLYFSSSPPLLLDAQDVEVRSPAP